MVIISVDIFKRKARPQQQQAVKTVIKMSVTPFFR